MTAAIVAIAAAQFAQGVPLVQVFFVAVALAIAAIPEGLPVAITVALSIATARMARRSVIVRALPAVEGLGACTLIASDKTGTLTCNELTAKRVLLPDGTDVEVAGEGYVPTGSLRHAGRPLTGVQADAARRLALAGALCNEATLTVDGADASHMGDTVDVAFLVLAAKLGLDRAAVLAEHPAVGTIPYEPHRRFAAAFHAGPGGSCAVHVKVRRRRC